MASLFQRIVTALAPIPEAKAETGSGWISMATLPHLNSLSRSPNKLMAEAEALFTSAPWVAEVERIISGRMGRVPYHLEDEQGETLSRKMGPKVTSLLDAIDYPSTTPSRSRRQLWSLTGRHKGLAGNGIWYLDQRELLGGTPLQTLYINPVRMTPVDDSGGNMLGWIMDHPQNPMTPLGIEPTPFELKEIIHFKLDEPDTGHWGVGIPQSAYSKIEISRLTDRHTGQVLASGGRLAGIIAPKDSSVTIGDDAWQAIVRDYRNIVNDPDSAKRLQVMRAPVDFIKTSSDSQELGLSELLTKSRDDTFALWGVPLSQAGVVSARGLNSGDIPQFEEAALWQGPIEERLHGFRQKVQREFIDLWQAHGVTATLVLDTPSFDDDAPRYTNAERAVKVPLTNDERRAVVGLDPLEDKGLGKLIYLDQSLVPLNSEPPTPAVSLGDLTPSEPQPIPTVKASPLETLRAKTEVTWEPRIRKVVSAVLTEQRGHIASRIEAKHSHLSRKPTDTAVWWNSAKERKRLEEALEPLVLEMAREVANRASDKFPAKAMDAGYLDSLAAFIRKRVGERIVAISETTRDDISRLVQVGVEAGLSPTELGASIADATAFGEARAEMISRTETMFAYNDAALRTYGELGAERVQAIDGDVDEACAARNGREFSVDEAFGISDHPNGTLDWIPIVPAKAELDFAAMLADSEARLVAMIAQRPVNVEVHPSPVTIADGAIQYHAAPITVEAPPPANLSVTVPSGNRKVTLLKNEAGQITGSVETEE